MKIPRICKIQEVVKQESTNYAINGVYYDPKEEIVVATNGHAMAIIPTKHTNKNCKSILTTPQIDSPAKEKETIISTKAIKASQKRQNQGVLLVEETVCKLLDGTIYPNIEGKFPDWKTIIPDMSSGGGYDIKIGIDAVHLHQLAKALGDDKLCLTIKVENNRVYQPYYVTPLTNNIGQYGVITPCKVN